MSPRAGWNWHRGMERHGTVNITFMFGHIQMLCFVMLCYFQVARERNEPMRILNVNMFYVLCIIISIKIGFHWVGFHFLNYRRLIYDLRVINLRLKMNLLVNGYRFVFLLSRLFYLYILLKLCWPITCTIN